MAVLHRSRIAAQILIALLALIGAIMLTGCGGGSSVPAATRFATSYAGNWSGNWSDIDGTNGTSMMVIAVNSVTHTASVTIALSGGKFGFAGSQAPLTGTFDSNGIHVAGPAGQSATVTLTIDTSGQFSGTATNVSANVTSIDFGGPSTPTSVTMSVTLHHADGTTDTGTITLTKQSA
ncbi:MAG TPA: hypothetical protein VKT77_20540 [Chthonomonadaceae bacterium]|nr:hypothetical protein [Chthonomonadaceae bacterium]